MTENGTANGSQTTRVEQLNQLVRAVVVLAFTFGVVYGFVGSKVVSTESFLVIGSVVFTWWFKSRDEVKSVGPAGPSTGVAPGGRG